MCSFNYTARPPMTLFMHVLSDLLPKNFLALKQYRVFYFFKVHGDTRKSKHRNLESIELERERTVGAGISYLI